MTLNIKQLNKNYGENIIFKQFNVDLKENTINCILGPSGCGKTTLLNIIAKLDRDFIGKLVGFKDKTFSYIFQEPRLLNWFSVYKNLQVILKDYENREKIIDKYLKMVGLYEYRDYYPHQLSGGMKQRLSIARAFAFKSDILLMDEPFKGLDPKLKKNLIDSFINLWEQDKRTIIFVTHDIDEAILLGDDIFIFKEKPISKMLNVNIDIDRRNRNLENEIIRRKKNIIYSILVKDEE